MLFSPHYVGRKSGADVRYAHEPQKKTFYDVSKFALCGGASVTLVASVQKTT